MSSKRSMRRFRMTPLSWIRTVWKQKFLLGSIWLVCSAIAVTTAYMLPPVYKSSVVILIEGQRIPKDFVAPTVDADLRDRLSKLKQQILSYPRLLETIKKFNLYAEQRKHRVEEEVVEMMRADIDVQVEKDWKEDRPGAFRIVYRGPSPTIVSMVANQLGSLFIEENIRAREVQANGTAEFLDSQLVEAKKRLEEQETKLSAYKLKHNGQLPEQENALLTRLNQLQVQLQGVQDASARAQQNKLMAETSLKLAQDSLRTVTEMAQRGFDVTSPSAGTSGRPPVRQSEKLASELTELEQKYTPDHPDVIHTRRLLAATRQKEAKEEQEKEKAAAEIANTNEAPAKPGKSPETVFMTQSLARERERVEQLKSQLTVINKQIADYERERQATLQDIAGLRARVEQLPVREQEITSVTRDYQISRANYQSLLDKKLAAEMAGDMERRQKAERFSMLEPARVPEKPFQPNRPLLAGGGCFLGLLIATALAVGRELRRGVLLGEWELPSDVVVLARVPAISMKTKPKKQRRKKGQVAVLTVAGAIVIVVCAATMYFIGGLS